MSNLNCNNEFELSSGKTCQLIRIRKDLIPNYYVLAFPKTQGTSYAQKLATELVGDPEAFSILYSGYSARREQGWHIHIVLLGNRWKKAWLYMVLSGKNLAQALGFRKDDAPRIKE